MTAEAYVVFVSMPRDEARNMAKALVESRQAACVNIIPKIESYFMWQESAEFDEESLLIIKTSAARFESMKEFIAEVHPYELPEIIAVPITAALPEYVEWIKKETEVSEA
jgi:periplasmic divalent cation tolerance protein